MGDNYSLGKCTKGPLCPFTHDTSTVAICPIYFQTGQCPAEENCDLSHDPSPERVPTCLHFLRGRCSKSECRYAHVRVNPSAMVCREFSIFGYCSKGILCDQHHVHECPDWSNTGSCQSKRCRLPHVDRAGQIRRQTANKSDAFTEVGNEASDESEEDDLSSEGEDLYEIDSDDIDSEGLNDDSVVSELPATDNDVHRQDNFIQF